MTGANAKGSYQLDRLAVHAQGLGQQLVRKICPPSLVALNYRNNIHILCIIYSVIKRLTPARCSNWGTMPNPALLRGCRGQVGAHRQVVKALSERVDTLVHEGVLVLKLDVEGFEPSAFQSMKGLFDSQECAPLLRHHLQTLNPKPRAHPP